ncbi:MAG: fibronectin type III domain-containing protein [Acidobacteria bacterium]|nr:fibronectin type III domain-containing protein [Acidobacteriota bacterium]
MDELAPQPCDAVAQNRRIEIRFQNKDARTIEIWRREGDTTGWELITTTTRSRYTDRPIKPGQYYEYRIRTVEGKEVSDFSPSTVVYGK